MSGINEKMGLRPAGTRRMMKRLPPTRAERTALTSAKCPACARTGARLSQMFEGDYVCTWCEFRWTPEPPAVRS